MYNTEKAEPNCIVYLRDGHRTEFRSASLEIVKGNSKPPSGTLLPRKSARSYAAAFRTGLPEILACALLREIEKFLKKGRPPKIQAIAVVGDGKAVEVLEVRGLQLHTAAQHIIPNVAALKKRGNLPWNVVLYFGSMRHWKDALDDVRNLMQDIKEKGLLRGHIELPWGSIEVVERRERGIYALLERPSTDYDDDEEDWDDVDYEDALNLLS